LAEVARSVRERFRPPEARAAACLNCDAPLVGPFCAQCGQRDVPPYPSVRELVVDTFWELSGWDGRFASTVRTLFRHPGALTRAFLEGRRAQFLSPLRLYLLASLAYFLVAAAVPHSASNGTVAVDGLRVGATARSTAASRVSEDALRSTRDQAPLTGAARDSALTDLAKAPRILRPLFSRLVLDPAGFRRGLVETMPRALFILVPVFAGIVAVFYRRRKYPEHLYFAIHLHAFVFLVFAMTALTQFVRISQVNVAARLLAFLWIAAYATIAFRRTYGGSVSATLVKEAGIGALYLFASFFALMATIYWVALFS
jgi:hypothetical protein